MKTIVLLHGFGASGETFSALSHRLTELGYHVLSPDLYTTKPFPSLFQQIDTLHQYLQAENVGSFVLCGHSLGGKVALTYATRYPTQISQLILFSPGGFHPFEKLQRLADFRPFCNFIGSPFFYWAVKVTGLRFVFKKKETIALLRSWCGRFKDWDLHRLRILGRNAKIPHVDMLIWGEKDTVLGHFTRWKARRTLKPAVYHEVKNGNHNFFRRHHQATANLLWTHLDKPE